MNRRIVVIFVGLAVLGSMFSLNASASCCWPNHWWRLHVVRENNPTDSFKARIKSIDGATITVKERPIIRHSLSWSYGCPTSPLPSYHHGSKHRHGKTTQEQTFIIPPYCHFSTTSGSRAALSNLQVGGVVTVGYAVQAQGGRVVVNITLGNTKS